LLYSLMRTAHHCVPANRLFRGFWPPMPSTSDVRKRKTQQQRRSSPSRPNRAQLKAMEVRTAESGASIAASRPQSPVSVGRARIAPRGFVLTRDAEMVYIRKDLRRLLITAAGLFVLMIVLLFLLD
jgi:hypothetical protein